MNKLKQKKPIEVAALQGGDDKSSKKAVVKKTQVGKAKKKINSKVSLKTSVSKKDSAKKRLVKDKKPTTQKNSQDVSGAVRLPNNMSVRAVEKTDVIKSNFDEYLRKSMYRIAYVTGLCFLLVGSTLAASQVVGVDTARLMLGEVASSLEVASSTTTTTEPLLIPDPVFQFVTKIPDELLDPFRVTLSVTNVKFIKTHLLRTGFPGAYTLEFEALPDNRYRVVIPADNPSLPPGFYRLSVFVMPQNALTGKVFTTREFRIGPAPIVVASSTNETESGSTTTGTTNSNEETVTTATTEKVDATAIDEVTDKTTEETNSEITVAEPVIPFVLNIPANAVLSGTRTFMVSAPPDSPWVELYARQLTSLNNPVIDLAEKRSGSWYFDINTTNLINGKYELVARTKQGTKLLTTKPVFISVYNAVPKAEQSAAAEVPVSTLQEESGIPGRDFFEKRFDPSSVTEIEPENVVERETNNLISDNQVSLDDLVKRYAVAAQSGDSILIKVADEAIEEKRKAIVIETLRDASLRDISDDIDARLLNQITDLKERINTFEQIRREKSAGETSLDTDKDGISDYDELHLYSSNPNEADSDNDGITDGIEIMRGYNPNDSASEAIIEYESPKRSVGLVREDVLQVNEVLPVIQVDEESTSPSPVKTEIRGKGLPNSFVTLYIFSTPTIVTIRTDADGQFVYTFDKELEDGQHDVYVAMTDNAGEIIAQSNPFSFIKEAQAFTPVNAAESGVITPAPITDSYKSSYNMVAGMGILAFGLILLMLGISLRPKEESVTENEDDDDTSHPNKSTSKLEHIDAS